jgi:hypothetical protein
MNDTTNKPKPVRMSERLADVQRRKAAPAPEHLEALDLAREHAETASEPAELGERLPFNVERAMVEVLDSIGRAREALARWEKLAGGSRAGSLVATKLDEARHWAGELPLPTPPRKAA